MKIYVCETASEYVCYIMCLDVLNVYNFVGVVKCVQVCSMHADFYEYITV